MKQYTREDILHDNGKYTVARIINDVSFASYCYGVKCRGGGARFRCYFTCACCDAFVPKDSPECFDECPNCFGYGRPPVPPPEVGI